MPNKLSTLKSKLFSLASPALSSRVELPVKKSQSQNFYVFACRDQVLHCFFAEISINSLKILNSASIPVPVLTLSNEEVLKPESLSETIRDVVELFSYENKSYASNERVPSVLIIESPRFLLSELVVDRPIPAGPKDLSLGRSDESKLIANSPFIESDTQYKLFTTNAKSDSESSPLNVIYASSRYLRSWAKTFELAELSAAYLGPPYIIIVKTLIKTLAAPFVLIDMQTTLSKLYVYNGTSVAEYPFPYGIANFMGPSNPMSFNSALFNMRLKKRLEELDLMSITKTSNIFSLGMTGYGHSTKPDNIQIADVTEEMLKIESLSLKYSPNLSEDKLARELAAIGGIAMKVILS